MPLKFLAVDDEDIVRGVLVKTLQKAEEGCIVKEASKPKEAVKIIKDGFSPDIAFLDIEMYGITGIELAKQIKDICPAVSIVFVTGYSEYALDAFSIHAHGYLLKPVTLKLVKKELESFKSRETEAVQASVTPAQKKLSVTCFGNFNASVNGEPLQFSRLKAKELLAYLIDKKGSACTTKEISAVLFEDKAYTHSLLSQVQTIISVLMKTLEQAGVADAVERGHNSLAICRDRVDCDFYNFISGDIDAINSYAGEYMANYEWADMTTGWLSQQTNQA